MEESLRARGIFRLQLEEDGEIVGDSGWMKNVIPVDGVLLYLVRTLGGIAASQQVAYVNVGTGTQPATNGTSLEGEVTHRASRISVSATNSGNTALQLLATIASSLSHNTASVNISNIGLFAQEATNGTVPLFAGNTFASSSWATNQAINITYQINFS